MRIVGATCILAMCACAHAREPAFHEWRVTPPPPSVTFAAPATHYNEPVEPPPSTVLGELVLETVRDVAARAGQPAPIADQRLFLASTALAAATPDDGVVPYSMLQFALQSNGVIEPSSEVLVEWVNLHAPRGGGVAERLRPSLEQIFRDHAISRVGLGAVERGRVGYSAVVLTLLASRIRTPPIPRSIAPGTTFDLELTLDPGLVQPWVGVTMPSGIVKTLVPQPKSADAFTVQLDCGGRTGKMIVEVRARGDADEGLATFPLWCGIEPPRTFEIAPSRKDALEDPSKGARQILELVNRERTILGRQPLLWDDALAQAARDHSQEMLRTHVVASQIPGGQSIRQRAEARRRDITTSGNVARAYSITEAHQGLIELPSTREKLVSDAATRLGVGIVYGPAVDGVRELYVTEVVAAPARDPWEPQSTH